MNAAAVTAVLGQLDRELWLVTAAAGDRHGGLIATFVSAASIVPQMPRMMVGIAKQHHTWELIEASHAFGLHLLSEEQVEWVWCFGLRSGRDTDKLAGLTTKIGTTGTPLLVDALAYLECRVETCLDTGDRTVYLAKVLDGGQATAKAPLTIHRLLQLAPPERMRELKEQLDRDAAVDAAAIHAWRSSV
jgi:flavin reductase (DIM6/NTAB) family NADH-FMN oxidoreductase RutF